jgi:hypothetical protein
MRTWRERSKNRDDNQWCRLKIRRMASRPSIGQDRGWWTRLSQSTTVFWIPDLVAKVNLGIAGLKNGKAAHD